jgi:hypothetical protein
VSKKSPCTCVRRLFVLFWKWGSTIRKTYRVAYVTSVTYSQPPAATYCAGGRLRLKCDGTRAETRFRFSAKRTSPFKSAGASVQSTTGNRGVRISGSNAGYTMFRGSAKGIGYPLHSLVSPSLPLPGLTVCYHVSTIHSSTMISTLTYILFPTGAQEIFVHRI